MSSRPVKNRRRREEPVKNTSRCDWRVIGHFLSGWSCTKLRFIRDKLPSLVTQRHTSVCVTAVSLPSYNKRSSCFVRHSLPLLLLLLFNDFVGLQRHPLLVHQFLSVQLPAGLHCQPLLISHEELATLREQKAARGNSGKHMACSRGLRCFWQASLN